MTIEAAGARKSRAAPTARRGERKKFKQGTAPPRYTSQAFLLSPQKPARPPPSCGWAQSLLFLVLAASMVTAVMIGHASSTSPLAQWLDRQDRGRPISSLALSLIVLASAVGTVLRAQMRGVVVRSDGARARYILSVRGTEDPGRWSWTQLERIVVDDRSVMFELWNGQFERMPPVRDTPALGELLERIAVARKIEVTRLPTVTRGADLESRT